MKLEITVPEVISIFKEIQQQPEALFKMIRADIKQTVGQYLSNLMNAEMTRFLGRQPYQRGQKEVNHRNGSYHRNFTLKQIGAVDVKVPRDRKADFRTRVIPRSKRYESGLAQDLSLMFLTGVSPLTLSMISKNDSYFHHNGQHYPVRMVTNGKPSFSPVSVSEKRINKNGNVRFD